MVRMTRYRESSCCKSLARFPRTLPQHTQRLERLKRSDKAAATILFRLRREVHLQEPEALSVLPDLLCVAPKSILNLVVRQSHHLSTCISCCEVLLPTSQLAGFRRTGGLLFAEEAQGADRGAQRNHWHPRSTLAVATKTTAPKETWVRTTAESAHCVVFTCKEAPCIECHQRRNSARRFESRSCPASWKAARNRRMG